MKINLQQFGGILPKVKAKNLPTSYAVVAENCTFEEAVLTSTKKDLLVSLGIPTTKDTKKVTYYVKNNNEYYIAFNHFADLIPAFENIKQKLFYYVDLDKKMYLYTLDNRSLLAGIPIPDVTIVATQNAAHKANKDNESVAYRISFVDEFNVEGGLSDKTSNIVFLSEDEFNKGIATTVTFKVNKIPPEYNLDPSKLRIRIYRSNTGQEVTYWQYLDSKVIDIKNTLTYQDKTPSSKLQETAITKDWLPPEADINHLITDGRGHACIAYDNTVSISVRNTPTAYPKNQKYIIPDRNIVAITATSYGILVLTNLDVYLLAGDDPANLSTTLLISKMPCLSKQSLVNIKDMVFFASKHSIVLIAEGRAQEITQSIIGKNLWDSLNVVNSVAFYYENNYIFKTDSAILEINISQNKMVLGTLTTKYKYITASEKTNKYIALDDVGNTYLFRESSENKTATWRSKIFNNLAQTTLACGRIYAENYPVKLTLYINQSPIFYQKITSDKVFRLGIPRKTNEWQFQVEFVGDLYAINLASSMKELRAGEIPQRE